MDEMVTTRASRATLGVVCVGVAVAIALVHNMQVEERRRLHKVTASNSADLKKKGVGGLWEGSVCSVFFPTTDSPAVCSSLALWRAGRAGGGA